MSISLCMIVKNEEKFLPDCLESVKNIVDEIILVDTGSDDRTIEIAKDYKAKIYHFKWIDDFSAARNYSLSKASGDWILYLDADERISHDSISELLLVKRINYKAAIYCSVVSEKKAMKSSDRMKYLRLFSNDKNIYFQGKVHEQIKNSLDNLNYTFLDSEIEIIHLGYDQEKEVIESKAARNLELLIKDFQIEPNCYKAFHIGQSLMILNRNIEAMKYFEFVIDDETFDIHHRSHAFRFLTASEIEKGNYLKAKELVDKGLHLKSEQPILNILAAEIYSELGIKDQSNMFLEKAYKYNLQYKTEPSYFEITIDNEIFLMRSLQLAIKNKSYKLISYFMDEAKKTNISNMNLSLIDNLEIIVGNKKELIKKINLTEIIKQYDFSWLVMYLENDLEMLENFINIWENNAPHTVTFLKYSSDYFIGTKNYSKAIQNLKVLLNIYAEDPQIIINLMTLYITTNQIEEALKIIEHGLQVFNYNTEIKDRFLTIKNKLKS